MQLLLTFIETRGIDLNERISSGRFLDPYELDALVVAAYKGTESSKTSKRKLVEPFHSSNILAHSNKSKTERGKAKRGTVAPSTVGLRLRYARRYLEWLGKRAAGRVGSTLERRRMYMDRLTEFCRELQVRTPSERTGDRLSMTEEETKALRRVIDPACSENSWEAMPIRIRNRLYIEWLRGTGLRLGELLGIEIKNINFATNTVTILRRSGDPKDKRRRQPKTKTRAREVPISRELVALTHDYIINVRATTRRAKKHGFLFVARNGDPLSLSSIAKLFSTLREKHPAVGGSLSSHVFRHSWNEAFSEVADEHGLSEEDERRARIHSMGWSDHSKMPDLYLKRRTRRIAAEASISIQNKMLNHTGVSEN
ncbi:tyrosine-type recombinase/integrase [Microvirga tunisiensis]|uniref:tyrosine-type recombinase/integrase n=1 Tax=Microvirga tunisiensis TaxID=2108360 RepID=UPI00128C7379